MGKKKITSNQAIATAGRRLPGTIPNKAMRIAKSAQVNSTRAQNGNSAKSATVQTMSDSLEDLVDSADRTTVSEVIYALTSHTLQLYRAEMPVSSLQFKGDHG